MPVDLEGPPGVDQYISPIAAAALKEAAKGSQTNGSSGYVYPYTTGTGYGTAPATSAYSTAYNGYYYPYAAYNSWYNYPYTQSASNGVSAGASTAKPPPLPVGYNGTAAKDSSANRAAASTASTYSYGAYNPYGGTTSYQYSTVSAGGAYANPFAAMPSSTPKTPVKVEAPKKKRVSKFDLAAEPAPPPKSESSMPLINPGNLSWKAINRVPGVKSIAELEARVEAEKQLKQQMKAAKVAAKTPPKAAVNTITKDVLLGTKKEKKKAKREKKERMSAILEEEFIPLENAAKRKERFHVSSEKEITTIEPNVVMKSAERPEKPLVGTQTKMEKQYLRLTCNPTPDMIRPKVVLQKWLRVLESRMKLGEIEYEYYSDQLRAIRQDLTVQHIHDSFTVEVYEQHARVALKHQDLNEFNRCETQLKELYITNPSSNQIEFSCYQLLYSLFAQQYIDINNFLSSIPLRARRNPFLRQVLKVFMVIKREDFGGFFKYYRSKTLPYACNDFLEQFVNRMRIIGLFSIFSSVKPAISLYMLKNMLGYQNYEEAVSDLRKYQLNYVYKGNIKKLKDADAKNCTIPFSDGIHSLQQMQANEKGSKLL